MSGVRAGIVTYAAFPSLVDAAWPEAAETLASLNRYPAFGAYEIPAWLDAPRWALASILAGHVVLVGTQTQAIRNGWDLCSLDERVARQAVDFVERSLAFAEDIGARYVGVWSGRTRGQRREACLQALAERLERLADSFPEVYLVLEPFPPCTAGDVLISTAEQAVEICTWLDGKVGLMFDAAHHLLAGGSLPPRSPVRRYTEVLQLGNGWRSPAGDLEDAHPPFGVPGGLATWNEMVHLTRWMVEGGFSGIVDLEVKPWPGCEAGELIETLAEQARSLAELLPGTD